MSDMSRIPGGLGPLSSMDAERGSQSTASSLTDSIDFGGALSYNSTADLLREALLSRNLPEALRVHALIIVTERGVLLTRILALVQFCFGAPVFVSSLKDHERFTFLVVAMLLGCSSFAYSSLLAAWGTSAARWYDLTAFLLGLGSLVLSGLAQVHLAAIVDVHDGDISFGFVLDSLSVVMLCGALDVAAIGAQLAWRWALVLIHVSVVINFIWAFWYSAEVTEVENDAQMTSFIVLSAELYIIGVSAALFRCRKRSQEEHRFTAKFHKVAEHVTEQQDQLERQRELMYEGQSAIDICKSPSIKFDRASTLGHNRSRSSSRTSEVFVFSEGDTVLVEKPGPYEGRRAVVLKNARHRDHVQVHFEDDRDAGSSKWFSGKHLKKVGNGQRKSQAPFKTGDLLRIKEEGDLKSKTCVVMDPAWHGLVRVVLEKGGAQDRVLCFPPSALELIEDSTLKDLSDLVPVARFPSIGEAPDLAAQHEASDHGVGDPIPKETTLPLTGSQADAKGSRGNMSAWSAAFRRSESPTKKADEENRDEQHADHGMSSWGTSLLRRTLTHIQSPTKPEQQPSSPRMESMEKSMEKDESGPPATPNQSLSDKMKGLQANLGRIYTMARRLRDPDYNLREYFNDCCVSFPELKLFSNDSAQTSSARAASAEYQRTIGALFAVYWLFRAEGDDGRMGFCYGVDEEWQTMTLKSKRMKQSTSFGSTLKRTLQRMNTKHTINTLNTSASRPPSSITSGASNNDLGKLERKGSTSFTPSSHETERPGKALESETVPAQKGGNLSDLEIASRLLKKPFSHLTDEEKRFSFFFNIEWSMLHTLICEAGCGKESLSPVERTVALLALTAFHDIMKLADLLPVVQPEHAPYHGYAEGVTIRDHDVALSYVLEHYPKLLPSFKVLSPDQQRSIIFTQSKLGFNHGWFVQAEAPPGAMLTKFKGALQEGTRSEDIALYFLHWLTDLAGAEATPMNGAEKFVLKFPHAVLTSFLWSIPYLEQLRDKSETEVVETYLAARWKIIAPSAPVPDSREAIAIMRLAVMAQGDTMAVQAFYQLSDKDQKFLAREMSRTGHDHQSFKCRPKSSKGPAVLVYYGPALLQRNVGNLEDMTLAVSILCKVYYGARKLWPASQSTAGTTVQAQIAVLKEKATREIISPKAAGAKRFFVLVRHNDKECQVEEKRAQQINHDLEGDKKLHIFDFENDEEEDDDSSISEWDSEDDFANSDAEALKMPASTEPALPTNPATNGNGYPLSALAPASTIRFVMSV